MKFLYVLLPVFFATIIYAQESSVQDVPEIVKKKFSRKLPRAEDPYWSKVDSTYKVECFYRGRAAYAEFTPEGEWLITITDMDPKNLYSPIQRYLDENFKRDKVILAEKAVKADRENYYYVQLEHKDKETKEVHIIELFFDKTGRIEQAKIPEGINDMTIVGVDDPNLDVPADVIDSWKKRFPRAEGIDWTKKKNPSDSIDYNHIATFIYRDRPTKAEFLPDGSWIETRTQYEEKDLYTPVVRYIEENHWYDDLIIAEKVTRDDRNDYYYVKLERYERGQFRPYVFELFFSKTGKIQKVIRPEVLKSQYLLTVDIPDEVARKFKGRYASGEDVTWEKGEGKWIASFMYRDMPTTAEYSDSAEWIMTIQQLDLKRIYAPVQREIDKNYSDYRITYAEKATRKDRNNHYYVELVAKKSDVEPQKIGLFFDKSGRLKED